MSSAIDDVVSDTTDTKVGCRNEWWTDKAASASDSKACKTNANYENKRLLIESSAIVNVDLENWKSHGGRPGDSEDGTEYGSLKLGNI